MNLNQWAIKWGIPFEAVEDLRRDFGIINTDPQPKDGKSEAAIQTQVRLEATRKNMRLWRNNVGATYTKDGSFLRYGLANDSNKLNKSIKSSDLIGIYPLIIIPEHVGMTLGIFLAREIKKSDWQYSGTEEEQAQLKFLKLVASFGGDAAFANKEGAL